jgi:hypothetical protein
VLLFVSMGSSWGWTSASELVLLIGGLAVLAPAHTAWCSAS